MKTTVGKAKQDIATGWAASFGISVPTWTKGQEILVEDMGEGFYRPLGVKYSQVMIPKSLLDFDL